MMKGVVFLLALCCVGSYAVSSRAKLQNLKAQVVGCSGGFLCGMTTTSTSCTVNCVPVTNVCDGTPQCANGADEVGCPVTTPAPVTTPSPDCYCTAGEYQCANTTTCIPAEQMCNGEQNCPNNDDEANCPDCPAGTYRCAIGNVCVARNQICDGTDDCPVAGDDEFPGCRCNLLAADEFVSCAAVWNVADNADDEILMSVTADFDLCRSLCCAHADCDAFVIDDPNCYLLSNANPTLVTVFDDTAVACPTVPFYVVNTA